MISVLTAADVERVDAAAEAAGTPVERLMENAGWAVARAARTMMDGTYGRRVVVVCGKGNNAGDGLVAGRILYEQGAHVTAVLTTDALSPLAARNLDRFPGAIRHLDALPRELGRADLAIDAIFGVGLTRAPEGAMGEGVRELAQAPAPVLAIDIPSGVDSDTGQILGDAVVADDTITFGGFKPGLLFEPGRSHAGEIHLADIGTGVRDDPSIHVRVLEPDDVRQRLPLREESSHKRNTGTLLVVSGSRAMPGAAALVCGASVHSGSGLTVLCAPEDVCRVVLSRVPEVTTIPVPESSEGTIDAKALDLIRPRMEEFHAVAIGPGLSTHPATMEFVRAFVDEVSVPVVIDADAITALAGAIEAVELGRAILTPHAGELARLVDRKASELEGDRLAAATMVARQTKGVVLFKGPGTVITNGTHTLVNGTGGAPLAQGGTGDVLTGLIGSLIAQSSTGRTLSSIETVEVAAAAAWIHGLAAERIAHRQWPHPANASALIEEIGPTMHEILDG